MLDMTGVGVQSPKKERNLRLLIGGGAGFLFLALPLWAFGDFETFRAVFTFVSWPLAVAVTIMAVVRGFKAVTGKEAWYWIKFDANDKPAARTMSVVLTVLIWLIALYGWVTIVIQLVRTYG